MDTFSSLITFLHLLKSIKSMIIGIFHTHFLFGFVTYHVPQWKEKEKEADRRRGGKTISKSGQEWTLPAQLGHLPRQPSKVMG